MYRVHSGIRVHLTLRGCNSLYINPIGTKCTPNAFFFHAEDGKNIFISLLHFGDGKLATPPPPLRWLANSGLRVSGSFFSLWRAFAVLVRRQTRTPRKCRFVWRLATRSYDFLQENNDGERPEQVWFWNDFQTAYKVRMITVRLHTSNPPPPPPPRKSLTLIPEWPLFRNALYSKWRQGSKLSTGERTNFIAAPQSKNDWIFCFSSRKATFFTQDYVS